MRAAVISGRSKSSQWTIEALRNYFDEVDHLYIKHIDINFSGKKAEVLHGGRPVGRYDCVFIKGSFRYAQLLRALADLFSTDDRVFLPIKPNAYTLAHDKLLTQLVLQKKNLPMPRTYLSATIDAAKDVLAKMNYPIIMKFPQGTQGKGVMFADSFASASTILDALDALKQPFLVQEYVETGSCDVRLMVVGDKVVAAMKRKSKGSDKRANIHAGGFGEPFVPDEYMKKIAVQAAQAIGAEICGVDVLEGVTGPLIIELNISPGLQGITAATGVDVADRIAKYLYDCTKAMLAERKDAEAKKLMAGLNAGNGNGSHGKEHELITQLDFRGARVLLPEVVSKTLSLKEDDTVRIVSAKGRLEIKRFM
ncbi:RimK family alpha-L-glutamate ligase [Candidatus Woesearchaeota archaeon]|nr:RimK family alpha-L-glutamate ligase [Candidatus Woesearchaeota archaeon]